MLVSNPFKTGRYCVDHRARAHRLAGGVSNPFKTGRYCVEAVMGAVVTHLEFQTPSKRGGTA